MSFERFLSDNHITYSVCEPTSAHTTFRIGGCADWYLRPQNEEQLIAAVRYCTQNGIRYFTGGNFSNTVFADEGYRGAVIDTHALSQIDCEGQIISCGAGALLSSVCGAACRAGMTGLEFAYGIPGALGGALYMNAGAYGGEIADVVCSVRIYDPESDQVVVFSREACAYGHRTSAFMGTNVVILSAVLTLTADQPDQIRARMEQHLSARKQKQPLEFPSAGSVFKRPQGAFAGQLIEQLGLKGTQIGGAVVSQKHAGFIVNVGGATCADLVALIDLIRDRVYQEYQIELEPEVRIVR